MLLKPTFIVDKVSQITANLLNSADIKAVLLDVDNTLVSYKSHEPDDSALKWVSEMKALGFKLVIVSNNYAERVKPVADIFNLPYITFALKPLPIGYIKAKAKLNIAYKNCAIVGDQIFTDVLGANLCGMKSIWVSPIEKEESKSFIFRRNLEKKLKNKYQGGIKDE